MSDVSPPPATGVWYDVDVTVAAVLHTLRLQGGDIDATRIPDLIPAAALLIDHYYDSETVIAGPPPEPDFEMTLQQVVVELYRADVPAAGGFVPSGSPTALHLRDVIETGIGHRRQRWAVS